VSDSPPSVTDPTDKLKGRLFRRHPVDVTCPSVLSQAQILLRFLLSAYLHCLRSAAGNNGCIQKLHLLLACLALRLKVRMTFVIILYDCHYAYISDGSNFFFRRRKKASPIFSRFSVIISPTNNITMWLFST
jgi:hypothetical protein